MKRSQQFVEWHRQAVEAQRDDPHQTDHEAAVAAHLHKEAKAKAEDKVDQ